MKSASKYEPVVRNLHEYPHEQEWFEFKVNWFEPNGLGEYISALANAAAYQGQEFGYLVWGLKMKPTPSWERSSTRRKT
ncbi:MAG: hypothetical protein IKS83_01735 [Victivallales bacterium]|nr:hypothetical protein [Victivallales bacterium]